MKYFKAYNVLWIYIFCQNKTQIFYIKNCLQFVVWENQKETATLFQLIDDIKSDFCRDSAVDKILACNSTEEIQRAAK